PATPASPRPTPHKTAHHPCRTAAPPLAASSTKQPTALPDLMPSPSGQVRSTPHATPPDAADSPPSAQTHRTPPSPPEPRVPRQSTATAAIRSPAPAAADSLPSATDRVPSLSSVSKPEPSPPKTHTAPLHSRLRYPPTPAPAPHE